MYEEVNFNGWPNCIRLYNQEIELIVTTDIGPRIVKFGYINGQNILYLVPEHSGKCGGKQWLIYGGHRLWLAPEAIPFSYNPDNDPVDFQMGDNSIILKQKKESITGVVKEMEIGLAPDKNEVKILHRVINQNPDTVELSIWPITMLATGGRAIIPQEPYGEGNDYLLPARPLALWHYSKMNDPRWVWGEKYIEAIQNPAFKSEQKIGVLNKQGWIAYSVKDELLIKKFDYKQGAAYPDFGCNNEAYISEHYLEIETLSPLTKLSPGGTLEHIEHWQLNRIKAVKSEDEIDVNILPIVQQFKIV